MIIYIVTHKNYVFPKDCSYLPIKVGNKVHKKNISQMAIEDCTGDNIAHLNESFCELTAAYWIWKNSKEDIIGLVHYRRYFSSKRKELNIKGKNIASSMELKRYLDEYDVVVAKPRNYFFFSIKKHYIKAHYEKDYKLLEDIVSEMYPEYVNDFNKIMWGTSISLYNMFVGKKYIMDDYFDFLFSILFKLEKKVNYEEYDAYQKRVFGFIAERLFNVWLLKNAYRLKVKYLPIVNIEGENVLIKAYGLLKRHL